MQVRQLRSDPPSSELGAHLRGFARGQMREIVYCCRGVLRTVLAVLCNVAASNYEFPETRSTGNA